jgi:CheY-like chemotaxis protein
MKTESQAPLSALVVEDDLFLQELLEEMLGALGIERVHVAADGRLALNLLDTLQEPPTHILCDVFMPGMDGIEFTNRLAKRGYQGTVVLLSGVSPDMLESTRKLAEIRGLHIAATLSKPVSIEQLADALGLKAPLR